VSFPLPRSCRHTFGEAAADAWRPVRHQPSISGSVCVLVCVFANFISKIVLVPKYPLAQLRVLLHQPAQQDEEATPGDPVALRQRGLPHQG